MRTYNQAFCSYLEYQKETEIYNIRLPELGLMLAKIRTRF